MIKKVFFILSVFVFICSNAFALEPMRLKIRTELPLNLKTVGQGAQYYADSVGYKLVTQYPAPSESTKIANENIDFFARNNTILPIEEAILNLLAMNYSLIIDDEHKLFSFEKERAK